MADEKPSGGEGERAKPQKPKPKESLYEILGVDKVATGEF